MFREPVQQVLEKIKNEPFFKWPNKMAGEPKRCNPNLYCHYHQDHGHTTEDCRNLWDHLEQLAQEGKLNQLLHPSSGRGGQAGSEMRGDTSSRLPLGTINVIFVAPGRTGSCPSSPPWGGKDREVEPRTPTCSVGDRKLPKLNPSI